MFIQVATEELIFRGYFTQLLAAHFQSKVIWMGVPSVLFGLGHYAPSTYGENAWLIVGITCLFGLMLTEVTVRTGNLAPAIAVHFVNNIFALLIVGLDGDLSMLSLYVMPFGAEDVEALRTALLLSIGYLIALFVAFLVLWPIFQRRRLLA